MFCSMSDTVWKGPNRSKYEICQDITSEIYKRIDITFAIKENETKEIESESEIIDSNDLSNGTDLFAYDKTDSLSSSITLEEDRKVINLNNNEEIKKPMRKIARVKKRYRKRVKKKQRHLVVDCSSDEEPLSCKVGETRKKIKIKIIKTDSELVESESNEGNAAAKQGNIHSSKENESIYTSSDPKSAVDSSVRFETTLAQETLETQERGYCTHQDSSAAKAIDKSTELELKERDRSAKAPAKERDDKKKEERKECEHCRLSFSSIRGLRRHMKKRCIGRVTDATEGDGKIYTCRKCDYRGENEASLRRHVGVHSRGTAERKYACGECSRRYTQRSTLRVHARTHSGERPHRCGICDKCFTRHDTWKRHQRVHARVSNPHHTQPSSPTHTADSASRTHNAEETTLSNIDE